MGQEIRHIGQEQPLSNKSQSNKNEHPDDFVLQKDIFNNVFEKDIRRVFIYKKAERLAKALAVVGPAFAGATSLKARLDASAVVLVDTALLPLVEMREKLPRELLSLVSVLTVARTSALLSRMNADLISKEAQYLLQEIAAYEEPRVTLDDLPTLAAMDKAAPREERAHPVSAPSAKTPHKTQETDKGHLKDREEAIMSIIKNKGQVSIKDISHLIRGVSEKTIQRELVSLTERGRVVKRGERRWSTYSLA
jgi:DNA-binding transcriptional ArsR family regulator